MSDHLEFVPYHEFIAAVGDVERAGGLRLQFGRKAVHARLVRHLMTVSGQPIALFKVPGVSNCVVITMDASTRQFYVVRWTECGGNILPIRPKAA